MGDLLESFDKIHHCLGIFETSERGIFRLEGDLPGRPLSPHSRASVHPCVVVSPFPLFSLFSHGSHPQTDGRGEQPYGSVSPICFREKNNKDERHYHCPVTIQVHGSE